MKWIFPFVDSALRFRTEFLIPHKEFDVKMSAHYKERSRNTATLSKRALLCMAAYSAFAANAQKVEQPQTSDSGDTQLKVFKEAAYKSGFDKHFNDFAAVHDEEGWAYINMMINPEGVPYEITVVDSNGNEKFNEAAIKNASRWRFEPATDGGKPIHSSSSGRFTNYTDAARGARRQFVALYKNFLAAITANDKDSAREIMDSMRPIRPYEDAYLGFAKYNYAFKWGTENEQVSALRRAISYQHEHPLLPAAMYKTALSTLFPLEAKIQDYAAALETWKSLQKLKLSDVESKRFKEIATGIEAFRSKTQPFLVLGEISNLSSWHITLFRRKFQIEVSQGKIDEIKLRCDKKYLFFPFNADLLYQISPTVGVCHLELLGSQGTTFNLIQT